MVSNKKKKIKLFCLLYKLSSLIFLDSRAATKIVSRCIQFKKLISSGNTLTALPDGRSFKDPVWTDITNKIIEQKKLQMGYYLAVDVFFSLKKIIYKVFKNTFVLIDF